MLIGSLRQENVSSHWCNSILYMINSKENNKFNAMIYAAQFICDTGPDAFAPFGIDVPQTCIDVPSEDGLIERCFYTYIPESCSTKDITNPPLVVDSHGQGSCAFWSAGYTGWQQKAQEECFVVVWPQGGRSMLAGNCFDVPGFLPSSEVPGAEDTDLSTVSL